MSKLLKLRGFVSVNEAQDYLSKAIGENVSLAEIYQLVLNRDLVISARFDAHEPALLGKYIPFTPEQHSEWLKKSQIPEEWDWVDADYIYYDEYKEQHYALKPSLTNITGCWDFTMLGSEAKVIDHNYRMQAANSLEGGLFGVELKIPREDILLTDGKQLARLQPENESKKHLIFDYFLNKLVVRKQELNRLIQALEDESPVQEQEKPLASKERNTLYKLIGALCKHADIDPLARGAATPLEKITELAGTPLSNETIRQILIKMKK
ncbi:hypothetical protein A3K86_11620 [Photobacterium jeanii]|uniref:Uncharacterized protein n=1 Tax=Photobacterium jeanii TaxID=858640 RepID=A0A178KA68_9GAMM|nr:hypothetical protein [Photobacterium jeanii]OAN14221.1 hypothetical protein A3K86_11620 [Photobacterium jeanii]PST89742.1 hypothetical protein C9I91_12235 [Photobacterium jeanii]